MLLDEEICQEVSTETLQMLKNYIPRRVRLPDQSHSDDVSRQAHMSYALKLAHQILCVPLHDQRRTFPGMAVAVGTMRACNYPEVGVEVVDDRRELVLVEARKTSPLVLRMMLTCDVHAHIVGALDSEDLSSHSMTDQNTKVRAVVLRDH